MPEAAARALGLGAVAGLRSMAAPAALGRAVSAGRIGGLQDTPFAALGFPGVSAALQALAIGELFVDKVPAAPSRTSPLPLLGRAASGALVGAALFASERRRAAPGVALGAVAEVVAACAGERVRLEIGERIGVADPLVALMEDGIVVLLGACLLR